MTGGKRRDLTGLVFGRLTAIEDVGKNKAGHRLWSCVCICGTMRTIAATTLLTGLTTSCGCYLHEVIVKCHTIHGEGGGKSKERSVEYQTLHRMIQRCHNPSNPQYADYGGRGIIVCDRWRNDVAAFIADVGRRPSSEYSIDRYPDNDGNYEPGNARWATRDEQANNKRNNIKLTYRGETKRLAEWATMLNVVPLALYSRLRQGFTVEQAITQPFRRSRSLGGPASERPHVKYVPKVTQVEAPRQ